MMHHFFKRSVSTLFAALLAFGMTGCSGEDGAAMVLDEKGQMAPVDPEDMKTGLYIQHMSGDVPVYYPLMNPTLGVETPTGGTPGSCIWYTSFDNAIPQVKKNDTLVYYSPDEIPETIHFWKLLDRGYSVGLKFLRDSETGDIRFPEEEGRCPYSAVGSVLESKLEDTSLDNVRVKEINGSTFKASTLLTGEGFVQKLDKDAMYNFGFYKGTVWDSVTLKADTHIFVFQSDLTTRSYVELKDRVFEVKLPEDMENGYYYVEGMGMLLYKAGDSSLLDEDGNGKIEPDQEDSKKD